MNEDAAFACWADTSSPESCMGGRWGAGEGRGRETRRSKKKYGVPAEEPETEIMEPKNGLIWS